MTCKVYPKSGRSEDHAGGVRRFVDGEADEGDLAGFLKDIRLAVERFQVGIFSLPIQ